MTAKNRYPRHSKISEAKFRELVKLFALELEATQFAELAKLNRNTVNRFLRASRERLADHSEPQSPFAGEVEVDESFFGARHVKGKTHINGIEGFWGFAKARIARFRGMSKATFNLHLKECEFWFNSRGDNLYRTILKIVHEKPLF